MIGDYCAGRDKTRVGYIDPLNPDTDYSVDHLQDYSSDTLEEPTKDDFDQYNFEKDSFDDE